MPAQLNSLTHKTDANSSAPLSQYDFTVTRFTVAAVAGGYMAINIGANDVANNVGPAVGSGALPLSGAILFAAFFESAGALLAGGDVVSTISKGIIDPTAISSMKTSILAMGAALLARALWLNWIANGLAG